MRSMKIVGLLLLVSLLSIAALASPALGADEITAIRSFNTSTIASGETVRVTVNITTSTLVDSPALDEDIPAGWTVTEVNSAGWAYNAVNNDWLGPMGGVPADSAVTIVYDLTPASGDIGTYSVAGTVSGAYDVEINPPLGTPTSSTVAGETDIIIGSNSIHVYDGEDLLAVINAAMDGDTIYVHEGYYDCGEMIYLEGKSFSIIGDGPELVSINSMLGMILLDEDGQFTFENITLLHMEDYGFSIQATQTYLNNCVAGDVSTNNISMENCNITNRVSVDAGVVRNNVIHEIDANIVEPDVGVPSKTLVIENNTITATCTGPYKAGECRLSNSDAGSSLIFRNNILPNSPVLNLGRYVEVTGNTFIGGSPAIFIEDGPNAAPTLIYENTFDSCTEAILIDDSSIGTIYLNNFLNVGEVCTHAGLNAASPSVWESPAMDYTFRGVSYNGPLGNYYDDYTGAYAGEGVGDTPVVFTDLVAGDLGTDTYPLMGTWDAATSTIINDAPALSFVPEAVSVIEGQETEIQIMASAFPEGLSGYNLTVVIDNPTVAEIVSIEYPAWVSINNSSSMPGTSIYLKAVDGGSVVQAGAEGVVLATLTVSGKE
ncbi:MAG: hypothetical protein GQ576_05255, partial [Methanococcoides sp.]|nr:hypothetical protein [Methanococcoides sp.]